MAAPLPFYLLDKATADDLRAKTATRPVKADPTEVAIGPHAGQWILPAAAYNDFVDLRPILEMHKIEQLDIDTLWPPLDF